MKKFFAAFFFVFLLSGYGHAFMFFGDYTTGSTEELGSFTGEFKYNLISSSKAEIDVSLKNTSDPLNDGFITGFVFNIPSYLESIIDNTFSITDMSFYSGDFDSFELIGGEINNDISGAPFGHFDIGASLPNSFLSGNPPHEGIGVGQENLFSFLFESSSDLTALSEESFLNEYSNGSEEFMLVRFKGFADEGSDKVPAGSVSINPTPEPSTLVLLAAGILFAAFIMKRSVKA